jgi:phosphoribosylformimino-5-aminoimidazole carboxamide ribotide isomerase
MGFELIPAIDLRGGKCVRLRQGDYAQETVFSEDPGATAARWSEAGATVIHVVDLDGAAAGEPRNLEALRRIRSASTATLQFGGGLRTDAAVEDALEAGADRVVLGTALVNNPDWVAGLCARLADRIVVGIDTRNGKVATQGWLETSALTTDDVVARANDLGVRRALFTDIARDGTLEGPNLDGLRAVVQHARFDVIASGGVASTDDLVAIRRTGAAAAIVGQALYTGAIDFTAALALLREELT